MVNVLFIDDIKEQLDSIVDYFESETDLKNINIIKASSKSDAEKLVQETYDSGHKIDVVVTDMMMDEKDSGLKVLSFCHSIDPTIVTILYTANESRLDRMSVFEYGAFEVIEKNMLIGDSADEIVLKVKKALEYKRRIEYSNILKSHIDPTIAEQIEKTGSISLTKKMATIAFWDVRGFSKLCEQLNENLILISDFVSDYNAEAARIIKANNGILDKFIGDGIMAIFLATSESDEAIEAAALSAIKCGMQLSSAFQQVLLKHLNKWTRYSRSDIKISLGCGIHTGSVLFGDLGNSERRNITAISAHVNFASRIEGSSSDGTIIISQTTHSWCKDKIVAEKFDTLTEIKNISGDYDIYRVIGLKP